MNSTATGERDDLVLRRIDPRVAGYLYHELAVFDQICLNNGISYWAESGTLLGAVRNKGLIPWDDDLDLQLAPGAERVLDTDRVRKQLHAEGFQLKPVWFGFKVCPLVLPTFGRSVKEPDWLNPGSWAGTYSWPFIDVFLATYDPTNPDRILYHSEMAREWYPNYYFPIDDLFPLKRSRFGPAEISLPKNPQPYLTRAYGDDWNECAVQGSDHSTGEKNPLPLVVRLVTRDAAEYQYSELPDQGCTQESYRFYR